MTECDSGSRQELWRGFPALCANSGLLGFDAHAQDLPRVRYD
jgi:hypothetical protein